MDSHPSCLLLKKEDSKVLIYFIVVVKLVLANTSIDVNQVTRQGLALQIAIESRQIELAKYLLYKGADPK